MTVYYLPSLALLEARNWTDAVPLDGIVIKLGVVKAGDTDTE